MPRKPIQLDTARRKRLLEALGCGATLRLAAAAAGVSEDTLAKWRRTVSGLQAEIDTAEAQGAIQALGVIRQAAASGTWQAAAWLLERRYPFEYGRTPQPREEVTHPQTDPEADRRLAAIVAQTAAKLAAAQVDDTPPLPIHSQVDDAPQSKSSKSIDVAFG